MRQPQRNNPPNRNRAAPKANDPRKRGGPGYGKVDNRADNRGDNRGGGRAAPAGKEKEKKKEGAAGAVSIHNCFHHKILLI